MRPSEISPAHSCRVPHPGGRFPDCQGLTGRVHPRKPPAGPWNRAHDRRRRPQGTAVQLAGRGGAFSFAAAGGRRPGDASPPHHHHARGWLLRARGRERSRSDRPDRAVPRGPRVHADHPCTPIPCTRSDGEGAVVPALVRCRSCGLGRFGRGRVGASCFLPEPCHSRTAAAGFVCRADHHPDHRQCGRACFGGVLRRQGSGRHHARDRGWIVHPDRDVCGPAAGVHQSRHRPSDGFRLHRV